MTDCHCPSCTPNDIWPTFSAEFRAISEARSVIKMKAIADRRAYIADVEKKRGAESRAALEELVKQEWVKK